MENYQNIIKTSQLFANINQSELTILLSCLAGRYVTFSKQTAIYNEGDKVSAFGIVLSGVVEISQEDFWGNSTILSQISPGDLFAETYVFGKVEKIPVRVVAKTDTRVLLITQQQLTNRCLTNCLGHRQLIDNMLQIITMKNILLVQKMSLITKRSIREKVLAYLSGEAKKTQTNQFVIPFNRQELADFLSVDRCALSKELSIMQKEGILTYKKNYFILHRE